MWHKQTVDAPRHPVRYTVPIFLALHGAKTSSPPTIYTEDVQVSYNHIYP